MVQDAVKIITVLFLIIVPNAAHADRFSDLWYDGNAEISTYEISEMRYGEPRQGKRIMVFVTEPMRLSTHIKPDTKLPDNEKIPVIKLNDLRTFNTGIYDYSVMTSVFSAVESRNGITRFSPMKVAFTSQEWCGTVFEQTLRMDDHYTNTIYSYFESEGNSTYIFKHADSVLLEENLWILVRELRGKILEPGKSKPIAVIPSSWSRRKAHVPATIVKGTLVKGTMRHIKTSLGRKKAIPFTWLLDGKRTLVWVENKYPNKILAWEEPDGSKGRIIASRREPYWKQHGNRHEYLRGLLKIDSEYSGT